MPHPLRQDPGWRVSIADVGPWQGVPPSVRGGLNRAGIVITHVLHGPDDAAIGVPERVAEASHVLAAYPPQNVAAGRGLRGEFQIGH